MFEHKSKNKLMAMALVAMLAFCSFSVLLTDVDAGNNGETYTINLRVGDTFSYTPQVNLTENVSIAIDSSSDEGMVDCYDPESGVFTFQPNDTTAKKVKFVATWTKGSLVQTATQTIKFQVFTGLTISGGPTQTSIIGVDSAIGTTIYIPNVTGGISTYTYTPEIPDAISDYVSWNGTSFVTTGTIPSSVSSGSPYTIKLTAKDAGLPAGEDGKSNELESASITITLTLTVTEKYVIVSTPYFETFAGELGEGESRTTSFEVKTNSDKFGDVSDETISAYAVDSDGARVEGLASYSKGNVSIDISKAVFNGDETFREYTVKISATGHSASVGSLSATADVGLRIYADLEFISEPTISGSFAKAVANSTMDVLMTATFENATRILYCWGDGTVTTVNANGSESSTYSARHVYAEEKTYFITVYAENDKGTAKLITMYNAYNGDSQVVDHEPEQSFFEKHGYQFIAFGIVSIVSFAGFFLFGYQSRPVIVIAMVTAMLTVLTFMYNDLGGLLDALKGLL